MRWIDRSLKGSRKEDFRFRPLPKNELLNLCRESSVVIDAQHPKQQGLTMRTIEALGAKRKLITTNPDIKAYDFFNPNNILVVDRDNPVIPSEFLASPYQEIPADIYEKYSIDSWVKTLLD